MTKTNKLALCACIFVATLCTPHAIAQKKKSSDKEAYQFTDVKKIPVTEVKDQHRSGTCWSFASLAMIEAELLRTKDKTVDLAEMYIVRRTYEEKAKRYVRMHGEFNFSAGGAANDVTDMIAMYGALPEEAYPGLHYGEEKHTHGEMDAVLKAYLDQIIKRKTLSTAWFKGFQALLDTYLGEVPENFEYEGNQYNAMSFAKDFMGLDMKDYVMLSSFDYKEPHQDFILEVPDNWSLATSFNLELDEMMECIETSINNGYTVTWAADVSEKGFKWNKGIAIIPDVNLKDVSGTERDRWSDLTEEEKDKAMFSFKEVVPERVVNAQERQKAFDNYETTDDHGMLICGIAKDEKGNKYYLVKNSWDASNLYGGYLYASEAYVRYKTMSILVNRNGIPKSIKSMLK